MIEHIRSAQDFLKNLQPKRFKQVTTKILYLLYNPYPEDCKHLSGHPGFRRIDIAEFRICYEVCNGVVCIAIVGFRNDNSVYKELKKTIG